ncbi:MAG TPA: acetoacetate--CoA ligase [Acidimicrobiia bacterium]|nr:acetoacetate--CoA ligase [Acidimicrobiia bacterium]
MDDVIWRPDDARIRDSQLTKYMEWLGATRGLQFRSYGELWEWSTTDLDTFWMSIWEWFSPEAATQPTVVLSDERMPGAEWFSGATLNYGRHLLRSGADEPPAIIAVGEDGEPESISWADLESAAAGLRQTLLAAGVTKGDRVAAYVRNGPVAIVGLIACASIGAIWSSCSPDFAAAGVVDRFGQLEPKVLIASDGYRFNGKGFDRRAEIEQIAAAIGSIELLICERVLDEDAALPTAAARVIDWASAVSSGGEMEYEDVPFGHPLWVLFSSGTTGKPKGIVQSHGGILLEHLKAMSLQFDVTERDRLMIITSTTWMVWNILVAGLFVGATVVTYDGSATYPDLDIMWRLAADHGVTVMGAGAAYLQACLRAGLQPAAKFDLSGLRTIISTGSPLSDAGFDWVINRVGSDVWINSSSGGTDVCTSFVGGSPLLPVRRGRIQARLLGVDVQAFDGAGNTVVGTPGELVVRRPMPSMPIRFWDDDGTRYRDSYFDTYPGVWRHGDYISFAPDGSSVIYGRSDATLNRRGVRIGTAEIYSAVEGVPGVKEALVVGIELDQGDYYMPMFIALQDGTTDLSDGLRTQVREAIVTSLSPRHVPDDFIAVRAIPHTKTGKKIEVPIKRLFLGAKIEAVCDPAAVDDYHALEEIEAFALKWADGERVALRQS